MWALFSCARSHFCGGMKASLAMALVEHGSRACRSQAQGLKALRHMWDIPGPRMEPMSLIARSDLTTGPQGSNNINSFILPQIL